MELADDVTDCAILLDSVNKAISLIHHKQVENF